MENNQKFDLYQQAKEAYYNGNPIMGDSEFDALEIELGLENKGNIGSIRNPKYTIKHPFLMGSLSKVQIHRNKKNNSIDWKTYFEDAKAYFGNNEVIVSPKYDGCSFEIVFGLADRGYELVSCSGRGDGHYGKDLTPFLNKHINKIRNRLNNEKPLNNEALVVLRGEILVDKEVYENKYGDKFVNPRSFVAGVIGNDFDENDKDLISKIDDLSLVIYFIGYPVEHYEDDFHNSFVPFEYLPAEYWIGNLREEKSFECIYNKFDEFRKNTKFNLDGFVIKPIKENRIMISSEPRPSDCVAIKFLPMIAKTKVTSIEWNLGKSGEYIPNVRFEPVTMDGKQVSKANGFNYGYISENKIVPGTELTISLAGDIIPYIYEIGAPGQNTKDFGINNLNAEIIDDIHLMAIRSKEDRENDELYFSILALNIPGMGPEFAKKVVENERTKRNGDEILMDFLNLENTDKNDFPTNIFMLSPDDLKEDIEGKNGQKIANAYKKMIKLISLKDIISTCQFKQCGGRAAEKCEEYLITGKADFTNLPRIGYEWVMNQDSVEFQKIMNILDCLNKPLSSFKKGISTENSNQIPIIMTGEPNNYSTKKEFLKAHPEFRETGSWKEVKIVFTNDLNSNTGKMKKAREKNIEIRIY
ncbi:MAG: hypothetical protein J1F35_03710 [Erysipelotrichales bacterium]|nr:hypothetical protein [Erysipelotrichales bacterium]